MIGVPTTATDPDIRPARDDDAEGLISLIGSCFSEYPGCVLDVDGEEPELRAVAAAYAGRGGAFWVATSGGRVIGSVGLQPATTSATCELRKLYVDRTARRRGLGARLCRIVEEEARRRGARFVELWSDTRFTDAHRLYVRLGYTRGTGTRELHDRSRSVEYHFRKTLGPAPGRTGDGPAA